AAVDAVAFGARAQDRVEQCMDMRLRAGQLDAAAREVDRGREELAPGQATVGVVDRFEPGDRAGDGARGGADQEGLRGGRLAEADVDDLHLAAAVMLEAETTRRRDA